MRRLLITLCAYAWLLNMAAAGTVLPPLSATPMVFARNFFRALNEADEAQVTNLINSPAAARSGLTLIFMAAGGKSADELRQGLLLGAGKKLDIAKQHADFWSKECTCSDKGVALRLANGLYVQHDQQLQPQFNVQSQEFFNATAQALNFTDAEAAMRQVNNWLELQTFHTVRDLLSPAVFHAESSVILVNSLYFRAKWANGFSLERTALGDFWINEAQRMQLNMMRQVGQFRYGESKKLQAQILQLPFEESDMYMLFIVPQSITGLAALEEKLAGFDMNEVAARSIMQEVDITVPKFKLESDIDLKVPLQKLGIKRIFERGNADLSALFAPGSSQLLTEARQKVFLSVNEAGCDADASTPLKAAAASVNPERKYFKADRPFVFAIRSNKNVFFVGHFVKP
ncbi:Spn47C [Drosophila busckii]|uniref:Spn47C n=1 Tax=Drosophila busckii TaxID=30019 RepID=A0A0M4EB64_DROBS|nr:serine protease inhibitor 42Dd [Drosophila busckii]ALC40702.1 Spn47C [Drosophila busckii]